jgi:hypothetical protein
MRAIKKIQASLRAWRLRQRINCLAAICSYVRDIDAPEVFMDEAVYNNLGKLQDLSKKATFIEQMFDFELLPTDFKTKLKWPGRGAPKWFCDKAGVIFHRIIVSKKKLTEEKTGSQIERSCLTLVHCVDNQPEVVSLGQIIDTETDLQLIKVNFGDVHEAKVRAALVAMMTASYLKGVGCFARFYTSL